MNVAKIKKVLVINFFNLQHTKFDRLPHVIASHASEKKIAAHMLIPTCTFMSISQTYDAGEILTFSAV